MSRYPWIVHHRGGWCALPADAVPDPEAINDPTLCGYVVVLRGGHKRGVPSCTECLALIAPPARLSLFKVYPIGLWQDKPAIASVLADAEQEFESRLVGVAVPTRRMRQIAFMRLTNDDTGTMPCVFEHADLVFVQWSAAVTPEP